MGRVAAFAAVLMLYALVPGCALFETDVERNARFEKDCASYGFKPGTDGMAHCMRAAWRDYRNAVADAFDQAGKSFKDAAPRPSVVCTTGAGMTICK